MRVLCCPSHVFWHNLSSGRVCFHHSGVQRTEACKLDQFSVSALPEASWVNLGKCLYLSEPPFLQMQMDHNNTYLIGLVGELNELIEFQHS